jgi:hypothetical protein
VATKIKLKRLQIQKLVEIKNNNKSQISWSKVLCSPENYSAQFRYRIGEKKQKAENKSAKECNFKFFLPGPQNLSASVKIITFKY